MTISNIGSVNISVRTAGGSAGLATTSFAADRILRELGSKPGILDTDAMKRMGLQPSFSSFDAKAVTPSELGLVSKNLYALGFIDKTTANLLVSAGTSLDAVGNQTKPNVKMNALEYLAAHIDSLRSANVNGNEYGFHVVPDYIKAVYVLQNLSDFAKDGQSAANAQSSVKTQVGNVQPSRPGINTWA